MENRIRAIIVDDEERARDVLEKLILRLDASVDIVDKCSDVPNAVESIKQNAPDVVFLDIEMPNYAGYELMSFFEEVNFKIIFVTAFDQYAIRAFELSAVDYLVKPVERMRLQEAIEKLHHQIQLENISAEHRVLVENMRSSEVQKIVIPELNKKHILEIENIVAIEALRAYSCIHLVEGESIVVSKHLKYFETNLASNERMFRVHKSWIVNLNHIEKHYPVKRELHMSNGVVATVSKNKREQFEVLLNKLTLG